MAEADHYTPPQAARILGLSRRRVTQMLNDGHLDGEKSDNGRWRVPADAVTALQGARAKQLSASSGRALVVSKPVEEVKDKVALLERRIERLDDYFSRLFARLDRLEDHMYEQEKKLNR